MLQSHLDDVRSNEAVIFYDWTTNKVVRRIDVPCRDVLWNDSGEMVAILSESSFYVLRFDQEAVDAAFEAGTPIEEDGIEEAFELLNEVSEHVRTGLWVGDCFIYNNSAWRLNYCVGGEVTTMFHLDRPMFLLGYLASQSRVYLIDREFGVVAYTLLLTLIEYKTLIIRGDLETAAKTLPNVPKDQYNNVARFLEGRGLVSEALYIATDPDYRFELAVQLGELDLALSIAGESGTEHKWRQLGELALSAGKLEVAEQCLGKAKDLSGLLLLHTAKGSAQGMEDLVQTCQAQGRSNVAFLGNFLLGHLDACVDLLISAGRTPEAAFFARTYTPHRISEVVQLWRKELCKINPKAAESLADPAQYKNLFPNIDLALQAEQDQAQKRAKPLPADRFTDFEGGSMRDVLADLENLGLQDGESLPQANGDVHHLPEVPDDIKLDDPIEENPSTAEHAAVAEQDVEEAFAAPEEDAADDGSDGLGDVDLDGGDLELAANGAPDDEADLEEDWDLDDDGDDDKAPKAA
ncbi:hypothetical protein WJX84_008248 [Apatococcus fuscideae]|uniref:Coatomer WD associated region domain-containing protein n=1 Tax=Apatococcus fuscideae TaxID=2026836 RepID=A0AAW1SM46_9CHLO